MKRHEVERVLRENLDHTRQVFEASRKQFTTTMDATPSQPNGTANSKLEIAHRTAVRAYTKAVKEYTDFILRGIIPERFTGMPR